MRSDLVCSHRSSQKSEDLFLTFRQDSGEFGRELAPFFQNRAQELLVSRPLRCVRVQQIDDYRIAAQKWGENTLGDCLGQRTIQLLVCLRSTPGDGAQGAVVTRVLTSAYRGSAAEVANRSA